MIIPPNKKVQALIRLARKKKKWTQKDLATRLGVAQTLISAWESGVYIPSAEVLFKIADQMDMDLDFVEKKSDTF